VIMCACVNVCMCVCKTIMRH